MGGVELLGDRHERDLVLLEHPHHPGKVHERAAQAVHLVDHHAVDLPRLDVLHEALNAGPLHVAAGKPAIVVAVWQTYPTLVLLAGDVSLGTLPLGVQGVELLLKALFGALAGVVRAAHLPFLAALWKFGHCFLRSSLGGRVEASAPSRSSSTRSSSVRSSIRIWPFPFASRRS